MLYKQWSQQQVNTGIKKLHYSYACSLTKSLLEPPPPATHILLPELFPELHT